MTRRDTHGAETAAPPPPHTQKEHLILSPRFLQHPLLPHGAVNALHVEGTQCCLNAMYMCVFTAIPDQKKVMQAKILPVALCPVSLLSAHHACDRGRSVTTYPDTKLMTCEVSASVPKWYVKKTKSRSLIFMICSHAHQFHGLVLPCSHV